MRRAAIVTQHSQLRPGVIAQRLTKSALAFDDAIVGMLRQHEGEPPVALPPQHVARVAAGGAKVRVHGWQGDTRPARPNHQQLQLMLDKPSLHRRLRAERHPRRAPFALNHFPQARAGLAEKLALSTQSSTS